MQNIINKVIECLDRKDYQDVIKYCDEIINSGYRNHIIYDIRGNCYFKIGNFDKALNDYEAAIILLKKKATENNKKELYSLYNRRGYCLIKIGKYDEAILQLEKALEHCDECSEVYNNLGTAYRKAGRIEEAIEFINIAIQKYPDNYEFYNNRGICNYLLKKKDECIADYTKAILISPEKANLYLNRGSAYYNLLNDYENALEDWKKAIEINPSLENMLEERIRNVEVKKEETIISEIKKTGDIVKDKEIDEVSIDELSKFEDVITSDIAKPEDKTEQKKDFEIDLSEKLKKIDVSEELAKIDISKEMSKYESLFSGEEGKIEDKQEEQEDIKIPDFNLKDIFEKNKEDEKATDEILKEEKLQEIPDKIIPDEVKTLHEQIQTTDDVKTYGKVKEGNSFIKYLFIILLFIAVTGFLIYYFASDFIHEKYKNIVTKEDTTTNVQTQEENKNETISDDTIKEIKTKGLEEEQFIKDTLKTVGDTEKNVSEETKTIEVINLGGGKNFVIQKQGNEYYIQIGSYKDRKVAEKKAKENDEHGIKTTINEAEIEGKGLFYRVKAGPYENYENAKEEIKKLKQ